MTSLPLRSKADEEARLRNQPSTSNTAAAPHLNLPLVLTPESEEGRELHNDDDEQQQKSEKKAHASAKATDETTSTEDDGPWARIFVRTPIPTLVLDADLDIIQVSDSFLALSGHTREECRGRSVFELTSIGIPAVGPAAYRNTISTAIAIRAPQVIVDVEWAGHSLSNLRVTPVHEGDRLCNILIEVLDITEMVPRRRPGREQLYVNETYRILIDTVKDYAIFMLDTEGYVLTWNAGASILKGYSAEDIIGQHFSVFYGQEDRIAEKPRKELEICKRDGKVEDEGWRYRKDGTRFWANVMIFPVHQCGRHVGFAKVTRDLTPRKAAEARLITAYEESSNMKTEFLANMSHEIRTPMHGMLLALTLLSGTELSENQREYVSIIEESGSILLQVINDVLDYSKLSSGSFSINADVLSVEDVVGSVVRNCRSALKPGVQLETVIQPNLPKHLRGDPLRFRQIVQNLVANAVKFTEQGYVRVHVSFTEESKGDGYIVRCEVVDSGIGVPEDAVSTLFTPFMRFANTTQQRYQGTGLGLSICKSLAELMDGSVGFVSNPGGQGSVFWLSLRLETLETSQSDKPQRMNTPSPDPSSAIRDVAPRKQLLLVEDNTVNQTIMLKLLKTLGFERVDAAWDGAEAVSLVRQKPLSYHAILMDINMPVMDGMQATQEIRKMKSDIPIIAMTGNALKGDEETYLAKGMNDYIAKPVNRQHLIRILLRWLE
ncbi:hypothetical protein DTO271D3_4642 [Paecilomyces variotii]|nr:hypothetical protein DTO271D3_4642 [Paecilomyces variotii]